MDERAKTWLKLLFLITICHADCAPKFTILLKQKNDVEGLLNIGEPEPDPVRAVHCLKACLHTDCGGIAMRGDKCHPTTDQMSLPPSSWTLFINPAFNPVTFVRRINGTVDFYLFWDDYKEGFGDPDGEFWLGLDELHMLTSTGSYGLWVGMRAWTGHTFWAEYSDFSVGAETGKYQVAVSGYNSDSTAGDSLTDMSDIDRVIDGMQFSTRDSDNDGSVSSCAQNCMGGWWFAKCQAAKPTGIYRQAHETHSFTDINWYSACVSDDCVVQSFQYMEMQIRPK